MQPLIDIRYGVLALPQTSTQTTVLGPVPLGLAAKACASQPSFRLAPQHRVLVSHPNSAKGTPKRSAFLGYNVQCWEGEGHLLTVENVGVMGLGVKGLAQLLLRHSEPQASF